MYKSTLGLGLGSAKKSDLNVYLKTLEKKNREVQKKFSNTGVEGTAEETEKSRVDTEDDSDLLSIKKEFQEEFDSPFIKKAIERRQSAIDEIPEATEVPFVSSLAVPRSAAGAGVNALHSFMKYDKKWRGKEGIKVSVKAETDSDSEPFITEPSVVSPVKIAEELEEKTFPHRRRRKSSSSSAARAGLAGLSPSPRSKSGRTRLKLEVTTPGLSSRKVSHDSQPTPIPTVSEMSEGLLSPKSPLFDILNIRDVSDVISEDIELETNHEYEEQKNDDDNSHPLSDLLMKKIAKGKTTAAIQQQQESFDKQSNKSIKLEVPETREENPFHFNASKFRAVEKTDSEPKAQIKVSKSNKRRSMILESESLVNSVIDEVSKQDDKVDEFDSESETLKDVEIVEKKTRKRWQKEPIKGETFLPFERPTMPREPSMESGCYYCRNICKAHQNLLASENPLTSAKGKYTRSEEVGVQAGKSTIHHYLFDPTEDAVFNDIHYPHFTNIDNNKIDIATSSIIDLMRKQLELMEHSMRSQKQLYRSFCRSLEKSQHRRFTQQPEERVLFGRTKRPVKLTFEEALRQVKDEMKQEGQKMREMSRSWKSSEKEDKSRKHSNRSISANNPEKSMDSSVTENIEEYETDFETEICTESQGTDSHES